MIRKLIPAAMLLCTSIVAQAQPGGQQYAPLQDHPTCTRDELVAATDAYVRAQGSGDVSGMPLAANARYLENMITIDADEGLWNTGLEIDNSMSFHDSTRCKTFTEIIVTDAGHPYVIGTRLYMHEGEIIRVDSLVTDTGDWLFNANAYLKFTVQEDWSALHEYQLSDPGQMIRGANAYLDAFSDKFTDIPWGIPCARLEGGAYTNAENAPDASCEIGIPAGVLYIVNRDYLIDEEKGVINVFCRFGNSTNGMPDSHTFRYIDGRLRAVHTLSVNLGTAPSPQADDNGGIIR